jgi:hypothetical protein
MAEKSDFLHGIQEIANHLNVSDYRTVMEWIGMGIPARKIFGKWRSRKSLINTWMDKFIVEKAK